MDERARTATRWQDAVDMPRGPFDDDPTAPVQSARGGGLKWMLVGDGQLTSFPLPSAGTRVVGRGSDSDIVVDDASLSRQHAAIHISDKGVEVEDLGSTNGTWVQARRLSSDRGHLELGDSLRVGDAVLLLHHAAVVDRIGTARFVTP